MDGEYLGLQLDVIHAAIDARLADRHASIMASQLPQSLDPPLARLGGIVGVDTYAEIALRGNLDMIVESQIVDRSNAGSVCQTMSMCVEKLHKITIFAHKVMKKALLILLFPLLIACGGQTVSIAQIVPTPIDSVVVVFSGDFMQHMPQVHAANYEGRFDYDSQLRYFAPFWQSADFAIINLETTLTADGRYSGYPMFASPTQIAGALRRAGITHVALANNHALDRSGDGVRKTVAALDSAGLIHTGVFTSDSAAQKTMILERNSLRVAIINFTYGTNGMPVPAGIIANTPLDTAAMGAAIDRAKSDSATHIVAFVHFGQEYRINPDNEQKQVALWLRGRGANLVVGSHPHVAQPIDAERSIVYSLGNFVSNQRERYTDGGYSVRVKFFRDFDRPIIEFMPHYVDLSASGAERYRVLMPSDSMIIVDPIERQRMRGTIQDIRRIIETKVDYE